MITGHAYLASTSDLVVVAEAIAGDWDGAGVSGHLLARNIDTGDELGFEVEELIPVASVIKVPIALTILDLAAHGELDLSEQITVDNATSSLGPTGVAAFSYPVSVAVGDLVLLMLTVSDNAAGDVLLEQVGSDEVNKRLTEWGCPEIRVRHGLHRMYECAAGAAGGDFALALDLATRSDHEGIHPIETLDPAFGNVGSARSLVNLLERVWRDQIAAPSATAELRRLMAMQVFTNRLSSDLRADSIRVSGREQEHSSTYATRSES